MTFFAKTVETELERLEALLARQERRIRLAFADFIRDVKSEAVVRSVADMVARGDVEGAMAVVETYVRRMASILPSVYSQIGDAEAAAIAQQLKPMGAVVAVSFNPTDTGAAMAITQATLEFIRDFTEKQRQATRQAMAAAFNTGAGTQAMARAFRDSIGLTATQERAVARYRALLVQGSGQALNRALRDRRYDRSVMAAAEGRKPLTPAQINTMVDRYRARYLAYRGETIARTEGTRAMSVARGLALEQNLRDAGLEGRHVEQTWRTTIDGRERDTHHAMNGQVRPWGQPFESPSGAVLRYPGDPLAPADEVINCRCQRTFRILANRAGSAL